MDSYYTLLNKIRERPGLYLGKKSLTLLTSFLNGYDLGVDVGTWETSTGLDFFENYDKATKSQIIASRNIDYAHTFHLFNEFVYAHYDCAPIVEGVKISSGSKSAACLILERCNSEEEAFDTYFELYDEFMKQS